MKKHKKIILFQLISLGIFTALSGQNKVEVWPGDVDNNGVVENIDLLYIGYAFGVEGPPRNNQRTDFVGWEADIWDATFAYNGINYAFADCNGDGLINELDAFTIDSNFSKKQGGFIFEEEYPTGGDFAPVTAVPDQSFVTNSDIVNFTFEIGDSQHPLTDFYGVAFSFTYDPDYVDSFDIASFEILQDAWIAGGEDPNEALLTVVDDNRETGEVQIGIVRKDRQGVTGFGPVATATIIIETVIIGPREDRIRYGVDSVFLINSDFEVLPMTWTEGEIENLTVSTKALNNQIEPIIFPNPTRTAARLSLPDHAEPVQRIWIYDLLGRVHNIPVTRHSSREFTLHTTSLSAGLYVLVAEARNELYRSPVRIE